ncbi:MAG: MBOAT family protein [Syntrophomonadaceae bacterium]|nr:MBOAT family protein [Syntrophomonadaceae bacterium]
MLFNSYEFIFVFLPLSTLIYFFLNHRGLGTAAKAWLVLCSLFFYSWWNIAYLPIIIASMLFNYMVGSALSRKSGTRGQEPCPNTGTRFLSPCPTRLLLSFGIIADIALLAYFKYADFFIGNMNLLFAADIPLLHLTLPLAISFFTFQQIAYLVDAYHAAAQEYDWLNYALFVTFFPHLIAGPIVHHREMMPQFRSLENKSWNYENAARGLLLFVIGLFKKVVIADALAVWASWGFDTAPALTFLEAWIVSLSYTFQIYFDFSGYTDMALGLALMFNIRLPINFNSPYKSLNIQEFWRRWHMTLSRFLRNYIYIPLGGNRSGELRLYSNLMITFLIGGLWHGAAWTFVFWGFLHGLALVLHRVWQQANIKMNKVLAWVICFNFINLTWVFFRARSWGDAVKVLQGMLGLNGMVLPDGLAAHLGSLAAWGVAFQKLALADIPRAVMFLSISLLIVLATRNSMQIEARFRPNLLSAVLVGAMAITAILSLTRVSEFLYFNF